MDCTDSRIVELETKIDTTVLVLLEVLKSVQHDKNTSSNVFWVLEKTINTLQKL